MSSATNSVLSMTEISLSHYFSNEVSKALAEI